MKKTEVKIELPEKVEAKIEKSFLIVKGPNGEIKKDIKNPQLSFSVKDNALLLSSPKSTKRDKKMVNTYSAHLRNMLKGVKEYHQYILKICSSHFPMNVSVSNNQLIIKNFIGEKFPRTLSIKEGVTVKVEGDKVIIQSVDKELAGTTASDIEKLTKRPNFDTRIFQDGIFIVSRGGKQIK